MGLTNSKELPPLIKLIVYQKPITLFVSVNGKPNPYKIDLESTDKVSLLRELLSETLKYDCSHVQIIFYDEPMNDDEKCLNHYKVKNFDSIVIQ
jgi:hypothetical protein